MFKDHKEAGYFQPRGKPAKEKRGLGMAGSAKKNFIFIIYLAACLVIIPELFFRYIIPAAQVPLGHFDTREAIYRYFPGQSGTYTFGFLSKYRSKWRINNYGWNSPVDYTPKKSVPRIAVIGDSFIEALHVDSGKSYPCLLREKLGDKYEVYSFGISAASLSEYLHISRYADKYFDPDIIIFNIIYNDFIDSISRYNKYYSRVFLTLSVDGERVTENNPTGDKGYTEFSPWKKFLRRHSALARYFIFNLKWRMFYRELADKDYVWHRGMEFEVTPEQKKEIIPAARYLIAKIKSENAGRKIIFVMDGPRECIYHGAGCAQSRWAYDLMRELCRDNGVYFLDLSAPMRADFTARGKKFNPDCDAHWNEYGHKLVAEAVDDFLKKNILSPEN